MDGTRIDAIAKGLGAAASRRRLLGGLAGALAVAMGQGPAAADAARRDRHSPKDASDRRKIRECVAGCRRDYSNGQGLLRARCTRACVRGVDLCNRVLCGPEEFCCNWSCSICAAKDGGTCTEQFCEEPEPEPEPEQPPATCHWYGTTLVCKGGDASATATCVNDVQDGDPAGGAMKKECENVVVEHGGDVVITP